GKDQPPGKYAVKLTITDDNSKNKDTKEISYNFELLPKAFGFIQPEAPAYGMVGDANFLFKVIIVGWQVDAKKMPNIDITVRVLDEAGKPTLIKPFISVNVPKDMPEEMQAEVSRMDIVPQVLPVYLNRPGNFFVEIEAYDKIAKTKAKMRFPVKAIDPY